MSDITDKAIQKGIDSFVATFGEVPTQYRLLAQYAPGAFAGYGIMRDFVMRDTAAGGALDLKTKEFIFALLDVQGGFTVGAKAHAVNAMKLGLTLPELAEGLAQVIMVGGISTWNIAGAEVLQHCVAVASPGEPQASEV
jgi:alkylhydroperoxidase/carboxymuconolactone decarboxylase family protein YurZ